MADQAWHAGRNPGRHSVALAASPSFQNTLSRRPAGEGRRFQPLGRLPALMGVPGVDVAPHAVTFQAIAFLDLAFELVTAAIDHVEIIVSELAPLFLDL